MILFYLLIKLGYKNGGKLCKKMSEEMEREVEQLFNDRSPEESYTFRLEEVLKVALAKLLSEGIITQEDVDKAIKYVCKDTIPLDF